MPVPSRKQVPNWAQRTAAQQDMHETSTSMERATSRHNHPSGLAQRDMPHKRRLRFFCKPCTRELDRTRRPGPGATCAKLSQARANVTPVLAPLALGDKLKILHARHNLAMDLQNAVHQFTLYVSSRNRAFDFAAPFTSSRNAAASGVRPEPELGTRASASRKGEPNPRRNSHAR